MLSTKEELEAILAKIIFINLYHRERNVKVAEENRNTQSRYYFLNTMSLERSHILWIGGDVRKIDDPLPVLLLDRSLYTHIHMYYILYIRDRDLIISTTRSV